jgi:hypothetical protein
MYTVVMSTSITGMRGIGYRSKSLPITLAIAQSFPSKRDALPGFNRVGRFRDLCKRARFSDTPILDFAQEKQMSLKPFKLVTILKKMQVQLKPLSYKQITTTFKQKGGNKNKPADMLSDAN